MEIKPVNPWKWQDAFGFSQAIEFSGHSRVLTCAGQTSVDADGAPLHEGDMAAQLGQALDNVETVLKQAGMTLSNVVHLNLYTTDSDACLEALRGSCRATRESKLPSGNHAPASGAAVRAPAHDRDGGHGRRLTPDCNADCHSEERRIWRGTSPPHYVTSAPLSESRFSSDTLGFSRTDPSYVRMT